MGYGVMEISTLLLHPQYSTGGCSNRVLISIIRPAGRAMEITRPVLTVLIFIIPPPWLTMGYGEMEISTLLLQPQGELKPKL